LTYQAASFATAVLLPETDEEPALQDIKYWPWPSVVNVAPLVPGH
jgi:hypothetical protein